MLPLRITILLLLGIIYFADAQEFPREQLEQNREAQIRKIEETSKILRKQESQTKSSMAKLQALQQQINQRNQLMLTLTSELTWLEQKMTESDAVINSLTSDLEGLKDEYAAMIYFSSKSGGAVEKLSYLFSSETVNQLVARVQYIKQYQQSRQAQISSIEKVKTTLTQRRDDFSEMEGEKSTLLDSLSSNNTQLYELQEKQNNLVITLKRKEENLKESLSQQRKVLSELDRKIEAQVKKQLVISEDGEVMLKETPKTSKTAANFEQTKGYMVWPVEEGFITARFGKHPHPVLKDIWVENNGVDIRTNTGAKVMAVYPGKVVWVTKVPGMDYMVLVQHGNYFTAYSRLKKVQVTLNEEVDKNQTLGTVSTNDEGVAEVQFQIWKNQFKVNPEYWLAK